MYVYEVCFCCDHVVPKVHVFFACEPLICCVFVGAQSLSTRGEISDGLDWQEVVLMWRIFSGSMMGETWTFCTLLWNQENELLPNA